MFGIVEETIIKKKQYRAKNLPKRFHFNNRFFRHSKKKLFFLNKFKLFNFFT